MNSPGQPLWDLRPITVPSREDVVVATLGVEAQGVASYLRTERWLGAAAESRGETDSVDEDNTLTEAVDELLATFWG